MEDSLDIPIALRRTRRSVGQPMQATEQTSAASPPCASPARPAKEILAARTPKSRKRRVRFSDPGPDTVPTRGGPSATGLTPIIRRASLSGSKTPRRRSTPARLFPSNGSGIPDLDPQGSPFGGEVHFLPLRQVLDGRVKRRIRRNGLSEEMNTISTERRRRAEETKAEIERLKEELAERDEEIERLHDETVVLDTDRIWNLEQQVAALRRELASRSGVQQVPSSPASEWIRAGRDPYSDDFMELDIGGDADVFGESTRAELVCSTPTRRMCASFPTPPGTSPEPQLPQTPCRREASPRTNAGVQAALPDPEKQLLEEELESLQLEVGKLTTTLESYSALTSRLSDRLTPFSPRPAPREPSAENSDLETHLSTVLQTLSDRTAALAELDTSLKSLGFPGSDAFEVIDSLRSGLRSARLELEYLAPGEVALPLTGSGAEVLDMVLVQLRNLAQKARAANNSIDEYHAIELSLRQQLNARVTAMDSLTNKLHTAERTAREKDARITDLEVGLARLKHAAQTYTRDISELETLVQRMETDLTARTTDLSAAQTQHQQTVAEKTATITTLEEKLAAALSQTTHLQSELTALSTTHASTLHSHTTELNTLTTSHKEDLASATKSHATTLTDRDARITELRAEMQRIGAALQEARDTVKRLRVENARLGEANGVLVGERKRAEEVVQGMRGALVGVLRMGEGFLAGPGPVGAELGVGEEVTGKVTTPLAGSGKVGRELLDGDLAESGRGNKRRKYDSGLGFLDEEEVGGDA